MPSLALIRDKYLNPWDVGNYYGITNHGVELYVCGTGNDVLWEDIKQLYPKAHVIQYVQPWEPLELEPDVIDVPDPHYPFSQYFAKRHPQVVITNWDNLPGKNTWSGDALNALANAWRCVARSSLTKETLLWDGVPEEKIKIIPGAVDIDFFKPDDQPREKAVLFVGRLVLEKGLLDLIWAMKDLNAELWIAGDGDRGYYQQWIDRIGIKVEWLGHLNRHDLAEAYRRAKVFCVPSIPKLDHDPYAVWLEQFGQVFIEAMASGTPIVSTTSGAIPEVVTGAGTLVAPRDWKKLHFRLGRLLHGDEKVWQTYSTVARALAKQKYSYDVVGEKIKEWYFS